MKLRSGRELPERIDKLPVNLENLLETKLHEFKTLFSNNLQHAYELLKLISKCKYRDHRIDVREKVAQMYDENNPATTAPLMRTAGDLMRLVIGNYQYHEIIVKRMNNFDLEVDLEADLLGNIEEN